LFSYILMLQTKFDFNRSEIYMKKLSDAKVGDYVKVIQNDAQDSLKERFLALGLTNGANIEVLRNGPKNNLTVFRIRGAMIALRKEESKYIEII
jgi:ferrous iron transport protein A